MAKEDNDDSYEDKEAMSEAIAKEVEEYLAKGGKVTEYEPFQSSDALDDFFRNNNHRYFED